MKVSQHHRIGALALASCLTLSACMSSGSGSDGEEGDGPIQIGISLPLTGDFSEPGKGVQRGYEAWADYVNENGGLLGRDVELTILDDQSNADRVASDYEKLINQDGVDLVFGPFSTRLVVPAAQVAKDYGFLFVEPAGAAEEVFTQGFDNLFYAAPAVADDHYNYLADAIEALPEDQRPKTAAYPTLDDPFAAPVVEGAREALEAAGVETVYEETYAIDTRNFDTIVNAMKSAQPELVVHGAQFEDGIGMTRAMLKAGLKPDMFFQTNAPSFGDQFTEGIGAENTEGVFYAGSHHPDAETPGNAEFVEAYEEEYGGLPPEDAADAYAAGQVLQTAVEEVGRIDDQQALADWLRENEVETILGPISWDETGRPEGEFLIGQWQDGKPQIVLPESAATTDSIVEQYGG